MELWNDFEGKLVDGRYPLDRLIGPKGRSAFFATRDEKGDPAVIRVIESLNDEEEILRRWGAVAALKEESLVRILAMGQTVLDGTHLVYAVMEPSDAELSEVLRDRALTTDETRQVAVSVANALKALHGAGLVHEHVEASSVWARGETVKLRSDVVREANDNLDTIRKVDVRDLSLLLLQCLTQRRDLEGLRGARLPVPFDEIIRRGESGGWGLEEIRAVLTPPSAPKPAAAPVRPASPVAPAATPRATQPAAKAAASGPAASGQTGTGAAGTGVVPAAAAAVAGAATAESPRFTPRSVSERLTPQPEGRLQAGADGERKRWGLLAAIGVGVLLLVLLGIHFLRGSRETKTVVQDTPSAVTVPDQSSDNRPPARDPHSAAAPVPETAAATAAPADSGAAAGSPSSTEASGTGPWRVVAFTYNRSDPAQGKVSEIAARHPDLHPEVFSPNGRGPYLVALGGWMTEREAESLRAKARGEGLPRDTYIRNYKSHGR